MMTTEYNGEKYEYSSSFIIDDVTYYTMVSETFKTIYAKVINDGGVDKLVFPTEQELQVINKLLVKNDTIAATYEPDIGYIIDSNPNISEIYKEDIKQAARLVISSCPKAKRRLFEYLQTVSMREVTDEEEEDLSKRNIKMGYAPTYGEHGTVFLFKGLIKDDNKLFHLVHELFHVASYDKEKGTMGFFNVNNSYGDSLNEGMTEYLTRIALEGKKCSYSGYDNDIFNVCLLSTIIDFDTIVDTFFDGGFYKLVQLYKEKTQNSMNFPKIVVAMDQEHMNRERNSNVTGNFKEQYLSAFLDDYKKVIWDNICINNQYSSQRMLELHLHSLYDLLTMMNENQTFKERIDQKFRDMVVFFIKTYKEKQGNNIGATGHSKI